MLSVIVIRNGNLHIGVCEVADDRIKIEIVICKYKTTDLMWQLKTFSSYMHEKCAFTPSTRIREVLLHAQGRENNKNICIDGQEGP